MKKSVLFSAMGVLAAFGTAAQAEEIGRVISSTPVIQQVAVPRQVCSGQPVVVQQPSSGGGAILGAIVGGIVGNQIGHGFGRAAATGIGAVAGAAVGNNVEAQGLPPAYAQAQQCTTQTWYENRTMGYHVIYEYAGKEYRVQLPYDPGPTIRLQVTPIGSSSLPPTSAEGSGTSPPGTPIATIVGQPTIVAPPSVYPAVYPAYAPAYPAYYYPRPYFYPPVGISLNLGYHRGGHGHRGHWR